MRAPRLMAYGGAVGPARFFTNLGAWLALFAVGGIALASAPIIVGVLLFGSVLGWPDSTAPQRFTPAASPVIAPRTDPYGQERIAVAVAQWERAWQRADAQTRAAWCAGRDTGAAWADRVGLEGDRAQTFARTYTDATSGPRIKERTTAPACAR